MKYPYSSFDPKIAAGSSLVLKVCSTSRRHADCVALSPGPGSPLIAAPLVCESATLIYPSSHPLVTASAFRQDAVAARFSVAAPLALALFFPDGTEMDCDEDVEVRGMVFFSSAPAYVTDFCFHLPFSIAAAERASSARPHLFPHRFAF